MNNSQSNTFDRTKYYAETILEFRAKWHLSQANMALLCDVSVWILRKLECGLQAPSANVWKKITQAMHDYCDILPASRVIKPQRFNGRTHFEFTPGQCYFIRVSHSQDHQRISGLNETYTFFRYVGREGIHHVFRHAAGNWTRTYTDAQLIGKLIEEVPE